MKITTKKIIAILPFDEAFKKQMLESYDGLDMDTKFTLEQLLWLTYDAYFDARLQENLTVAMEEFEEGKIPPSNQFYAEIREKTEKEIHEGAAEASETVDLTSTREKIEEIIKNSPQSPSQVTTEPQENS